MARRKQPGEGPPEQPASSTQFSAEPLKPGPVGRPTSLTPEVIEKIRESLTSIGYIEVTADYLGIPKRTLFHWMARGREEERKVNAGSPPQEREAIYLQLLQATRQALAGTMKRNNDLILKAAEKYYQAAAWYNERRWPEMWGASRDEIRDLKRQVQELTELVKGFASARPKEG